MFCSLLNEYVEVLASELVSSSDNSIAPAESASSSDEGRHGTHLLLEIAPEAVLVKG
jgi:hypothetical protein